MDVVIRAAGSHDLAEILRINAEALPHVARLTADDLRCFMALGGMAWATECGRRLCAYTLAASSSAAYDGEEFRCFQEMLEQPFLYVDQVAVESGARRSGVASQMYAHWTQWAADRNHRALCCEVNVRPPNPISMTFHGKLGFEALGEIETSDGRQVAMLSKRISSIGLEGAKRSAAMG
jgi:uncharacterized protein